jgi:hypothetical protein
MCFVEDLSGTHAPHTEWFDVHAIVFLHHEIVSSLLSILFPRFCMNKKRQC